jgi:hypothetical protein
MSERSTTGDESQGISQLYVFRLVPSWSDAEAGVGAGRGPVVIIVAMESDALHTSQGNEAPVFSVIEWRRKSIQPLPTPS